MILARQKGNPPVPPQVSTISPRRIIYMPNGATLFVESVPNAKNLIVRLDSSARQEQNDTANGERHLLEHLSVLGSTGDLDERLELHGAFLTASTRRDGLDISIAAKPTELNLCISALMEIAGPAAENKSPWWKESDLVREKKIINQEIALEPSPERLADQAWVVAYGSTASSPLGDPSELANVTLKEEQGLYAKSFRADHLCLDIEGPIEISTALAAGIQFLNSFQKPAVAGKWIPRVSRLKGFGSLFARADGSMRAVPVPSIFEPRCGAEIAAGLALATTIHGGYFIYTPSVLGSLVAIGSQDSGAIEKSVDSFSPDELAALFKVGRSLAIRFVERESKPADAGAYFRGYLLCQNPAARPRVLINQIKSMSEEEFIVAAEQFQSTHAIDVEGTR